ncbi:MAG: hypothetical protein OXT51_04000, partial [Chloroflexota bacterium]|nr:hypothetical protein [Chloroflexota bacterium]
MKDVEILLRGVAMLLRGNAYSPSMVKFLNGFSQEAKSFDQGLLVTLETLLQSFLASSSELNREMFQVNGRFSPMVFEAVFVAVCERQYGIGDSVIGKIEPSSVVSLRTDADFVAASQIRTTATDQVQLRIGRARELLAMV